MPAVFQREHFEHFIKRFRIGLFAVHHDRQRDIFLCIEDGNQVVELINQPDLPTPEDCELLFVLLIDILSVEEYFTGSGAVDAANDMKKR